MNLGLEAEYSTVDALQESSRVDSSFLSKLLVKHSSGLSVLAAPGKFTQSQPTVESINRLLAVARQDFDHVVVDMGSKLDFIETSLCKDAATLYLVTQAGIPELRNSNRLISQFFSRSGPKLEIVINRYESKGMGLDDDMITKALTRPAQWQIPNDYGAVREMQNTAAPLVLQDTKIARLIRQMATAASGQVVTEEKKKGFSFRRLGKNNSEKKDSADGLTSLRLTSGEPDGGNAPSGSPERPARSASETFVDRTSADDSDSSETAFTSRAPVPTDSHEVNGSEVEEREAPANARSAHRPAEPERRTYKGVEYFKGADGQWHQEKEVEEPVQDVPTIAWDEPEPICCGTPLGDSQCNAISSVPGTFLYTPPVGYVLPAGVHSLWVTFNPADNKRYTTTQTSVLLTVTKGTPVIEWLEPDPITYGVPLSATQLNATCALPGEFSYLPAAGKVLPSGIHELSVYFTPIASRDYCPTQAKVSLFVGKATPTIKWPTPDPITYGTPLSLMQLNASASVHGNFFYVPAMGAVLSAGIHTPSVIFTPTNSVDYTTAQSAVSLTVVKARPNIDWPAPDPIAYGEAIGAVQLNATSSIPGTFAYSPAPGTVLKPGTQTLSLTFTPTDSADYATEQASVPLTVTNAVSASIEWLTPAAISYGTALSAVQLNATASIPGSFAYTPGEGEVLPAGTHRLTVTFVPTDDTFETLQGEVSLSVAKATPVIEWQIPEPIVYGNVLGAGQLNATSSVAGTFAYSPAEGELLDVGAHKLEVTFTPIDEGEYHTAYASVSVSVTKATPAVEWATPEPITYGTALSTSQFCATAAIPGSFTYTPSPGDSLNAGEQKLTVEFSPADTKNYNGSQASVWLTVLKASPVLEWPTPASIQYGTALSSAQLNATSSVPGTFTYTPRAGTVLTSGSQNLLATFTPADIVNYATAQIAVPLNVEALSSMGPVSQTVLGTEAGDPLKALLNNGMRMRGRDQSIGIGMPIRTPEPPAGPRPVTPQNNTVARADIGKTTREISQVGSTTNKQSEVETRTYKGATYVKGSDGQWHLKQE
jgi:septum formation inhibitor-activating ATPase MinD